MPRRPLDGPRRITGDTASHATYGVGPATDYGADMGEGVYAPISGWVTHWWSDTGGWTVAVTSDDWKVTMQHHSGYRGPTSGWVKEGTLIAVVGSTGSATTGPHTHMWIERAKTGANRASFEGWLRDFMGWKNTARSGGRVPGPFSYSLAGNPGTTIPATPTETEEDMPQYDLIQSDDDTVWWCVDRILRYAIPNQAALDTYEVFYKQKTGFTAKVVKKSDAQAEAYGSPVYANPLERYATPKNVTDATKTIVAAVGTGSGGGGGGTTNLQPVLDKIAEIPTADDNGKAARLYIVKE